MQYCDLETSGIGKLVGLGYDFKVRMEFDICFLFTFLGAIRTFHTHRASPYVQLLDVLCSAYLLYSTFTRQFYLRNTEVAQWAKDICAAFTGDGDLMYNYISLSIVSWVASSFLEYTSSVRLVKLYKILVRRFCQFTWRFSQIEWSRGRFVVLLTATICTVISLFLTLILWGLVQKSLENVSQDISVLGFLTIAAFMRLLRQSVEGLTFIAGIAMRDFQWRNNSSESKKLFGHIAFSSFILLIHSSSLTYTFANQEQKVWGAAQYAVFAGLWTDVIFRLVVCVWAFFNSCCFVRLARSVPHFAHHVYTEVKLATQAFPHYCIRHVLYTINICVYLVQSIAHLYHILIAVCVFSISLVVVGIITCMFEAWQDYALHEQWQIEVDFDDPSLQMVQVRLENNWDTDQDELVCPPLSLQQCHFEDSLHIQCQELAQHHNNTTSRPHVVWPNSHSTLPFPPALPGSEPLSSSERVTPMSIDYADPVDIGSPFPHIRLETQSKQQVPLLETEIEQQIQPTLKHATVVTSTVTILKGTQAELV